MLPSCFHCGDQVDDVVNFWKGILSAEYSVGHLALQIECADAPARRLMFDPMAANRLLRGKLPIAVIESSLLAQGSA